MKLRREPLGFRGKGQDMAKTSLERAPFAYAAGERPQNRALRLTALLVGTGLFLHSSPTWAVNECGPPPPGGTVTCPPGEYPNGIDYVVPGNLEILLQPGVVTRSNSTINSSGTIRFIGPTATSLNSAPGDPQPDVLDIFAPGGAFINVDSVSSTSATGEGIHVETAGPVTILANTVSTTGNQGAFSGAVFVLVGFMSGVPVAGDVDVKVNSVTTSGASNGAAIRVRSSGRRDTHLEVLNISTAGTTSGGILVNGNNLVVDSGIITTLGADSPGIDAFASGDTGTVRSTAISTSGNSSFGIELSGDHDVSVISGTVVTRGSGLGLGSFGIRASSASGNTSITSTSVSTQGSGASFGIEGVAEGTVTIDSGTVTTVGDSARGIIGSSLSSVLINSGTVQTQGTFAPGIDALVRRGTITINSGSVTTTGANSTGIQATNIEGPIFLTAANISVSGAGSDAIVVNSPDVSTVTITGLVQSAQGSSLRAFGGAPVSGRAIVNIAAGGTLRGRVNLFDRNDRVENLGLFDAIGSSDFGLGEDLFNNQPNGVVRSVNGAAVFAGLETFNSGGTIEMRDGAANDSLTLPGAYVGTAGSRLGLDVDFAAGTADRLITGAATGSTAIEIQSIGVGDFTSGILLVDAGTGTSPTAFALAPGSDTPYLRSSLRFDAADNDFFLIRQPGTAVFETSRFGAMTTQLWYESADAVAAQLDTVRDGRRGRGVALWLQGWTGERERSGTQSLAGAGTFDVSHDQDFQGLQGGLDFQAGSAVIGITGGAGRSDAVFAATGNPVDMEVANVGLYAQVRVGPLFFNALAKRDWAELEIAPGAGLGAEFDADLFGAQLNTGLRLGFGVLFAEPSVGISWMKADLDSFASGPATVDPGDVDSLRARAGLRVGASLPLGGGTLLPYVAANVFEELGDGNETDFTLGETLRLFDEPAGTRGQAAAGVSFVDDGFEAFVRGEMDFSGDSDAKAVRAGARLRF